MSMELRIKLNGYTYSAKLSEEALRQLTEHCPLEETFVKSDDHEYYCRPKTGLHCSDSTSTSHVHRNGIYYFAAWNALSFVYKDKDIAPYQVAYLGELPAEISEVLETAGSRIHIRMEVSK